MNIMRPVLRNQVALLALLLAGCSHSQEKYSSPNKLSSTHTKNSKAITPPLRPGEKLKFVTDVPLSSSELDELSRLAPNLEVVSGASPEKALELAGSVHGIEFRLMARIGEQFLPRAQNLVWVVGSGLDGVESPRPALWQSTFDLLKSSRSKVHYTSERGTTTPAVAEHAISMMSSLSRHLPYYFANQTKKQWRKVGQETRGRTQLLAESTLLLVGLGNVGSEIAWRAHGLKMRVIAINREGRSDLSFIEKMGKQSDLAGFLPEADFVVVCVPLTSETEKLFDAATFARMKPGSYFINVARGRIVDTDALVSSLRSGRLSGAALDVTEPEPLPAYHPLWTLPNVIITPHAAAIWRLALKHRKELLFENLRRFSAGEPLLNILDLESALDLG